MSKNLYKELLSVLILPVVTLVAGEPFLFEALGVERRTGGGFRLAVGRRLTGFGVWRRQLCTHHSTGASVAPWLLTVGDRARLHPGSSFHASRQEDGKPYTLTGLGPGGQEGLQKLAELQKGVRCRKPWTPKAPQAAAKGCVDAKHPKREGNAKA